MSEIRSDNRRAYSLSEVAQMMGKHRSWAYRLARRGQIKIIKGYGTTLVPADEIERILQGLSNQQGQ